MNASFMIEGEMLLTDFIRLHPHTSPVTDAFEDGSEISRIDDDSKGWFKERDKRAGTFWDDEFCVSRASLSGAIDVGFSYATAYIGEAIFKVNSEEEREMFLEATDSACHPSGRILAVFYNFLEPLSKKGFGEF